VVLSVDEILIEVGKTKEFLSYPDTLLNTNFIATLDYAATLPTILFSTLVRHVSSRKIKHTVTLAWKHNVLFCGVHM